MSTLGLGLEGRVGLGRWRPVGGGSRHWNVSSPGSVLGAGNMAVNRIYKGKAGGKKQAENAPGTF